jgi:hypothetical protein
LGKLCCTYVVAKKTGLLNYNPITLGTGHKKYPGVEIKKYDMGVGTGGACNSYGGGDNV